MKNHLTSGQFCSAVVRKGALALYLALCTLGLGLTASAQEPRIITFDVPAAKNTLPVDINLWGTIVGNYPDANYVNHGFLRSPEGKFTTFDAPGAVNGTFPTGINLLGTVAGY